MLNYLCLYHVMPSNPCAVFNAWLVTAAPLSQGCLHHGRGQASCGVRTRGKGRETAPGWRRISASNPQHWDCIINRASLASGSNKIPLYHRKKAERKKNGVKKPEQFPYLFAVIEMGEKGVLKNTKLLYVAHIKIKMIILFKPCMTCFDSNSSHCSQTPIAKLGPGFRD